MTYESSFKLHRLRLYANFMLPATYIVININFFSKKGILEWKNKIELQQLFELFLA